MYFVACDSHIPLSEGEEKSSFPVANQKPPPYPRQRGTTFQRGYHTIIVISTDYKSALARGKGEEKNSGNLPGCQAPASARQATYLKEGCYIFSTLYYSFLFVLHSACLYCIKQALYPVSQLIFHAF